MTLTTTNQANPVWENLKLNDVPASLALNSKTVECQLKKTYELLADTEANIDMFDALIKLNLATNDVLSFINKQTIHKKVVRQPDLKVQKLAMSSKISDAVAFSKRLRKQRDILKARVSKKYDGD